MFAMTFIAVLAVQLIGYAVYRSYKAASVRVNTRRAAVLDRATRYTGPTYTSRER